MPSGFFSFGLRRGLKDFVLLDDGEEEGDALGTLNTPDEMRSLGLLEPRRLEDGEVLPEGVSKIAIADAMIVLNL